MEQNPAMNLNRFSRRQFLGAAAAGAVALAMPRWVFAAPAKDIPICVQLYSVRGDCAKDFDAAPASATFSYLAKAGTGAGAAHPWRDFP